MVYGIWHCILGACSQQRASNEHPRDGWLTQDGHRAGTEWTLEDLALKFRRPETEIKRAIEVLCSEKVKWIRKVEVPAECSPSAHPVSSECPERKKEGKKEVKEDTLQVEAPIGFPKNEQEAVDMAAAAGVDAATARERYNTLSGVGWKDGVGRNVTSFAHHCKGVFNKKQSERSEREGKTRNGHEIKRSSKKAFYLNIKGTDYFYDEQSQPKRKQFPDEGYFEAARQGFERWKQDVAQGMYDER
jgi:hypothetical protein